MTRQPKATGAVGQCNLGCLIGYWPRRIYPAFFNREGPAWSVQDLVGCGKRGKVSKLCALAVVIDRVTQLFFIFQCFACAQGYTIQWFVSD
jgi:hypothetical protein